MKSIATAGLVIISVFSLSGCIEETKSVDWWLAHPKETEPPRVSWRVFYL
ncbi:EexN family lipoprotein [Escherichia coli]